MPGGLVRCCLEKSVPLASPAAPGDDVRHPVGIEINNHGACLGIVHNSTDGNANDGVFPVSARLFLAAALLALFSIVVLLIPEVDQRSELFVGYKYDIGTLAAVAAVGPAARHVSFAPETNAARAAVTGSHFNFDPINKI